MTCAGDTLFVLGRSTTKCIEAFPGSTYYDTTVLLLLSRCQLNLLKKKTVAGALRLSGGEEFTVVCTVEMVRGQGRAGKPIIAPLSL